MKHSTPARPSGAGTIAALALADAIAQRDRLIAQRAALVGALYAAVDECRKIRSCNGYRESEPELWLAGSLHQIEDTARGALALAHALHIDVKPPKTPNDL